MGGLSEFFKSLGTARLAALALVAVTLLGFFGFIALRMGGEPKALLFSDVGVEDAAKMIAELDAAQVPYELRGNGSMIYVPQSQVLRLRMTLAGKGLPAGGTVGYEIFDNADSLGTTSFVQIICARSKASWRAPFARSRASRPRAFILCCPNASSSRATAASPLLRSY